tara:strand:+ start:882 stop:2447 length:1566 start_codon:yes stop_codon:yes gene_type:complete
MNLSKKIPEAVHKVGKLITDQGGTWFLVGGACVDALLANTPKDWDIEVHGLSFPEVAYALSTLSPHPVGKSFGIFKLDHRLVDGLEIDVSIPRRENTIGKGHKDFEVSFHPNMTPKDAAERRDFTINSMFYNPLTETILDPFGGLKDLQNGVLRMTSKEKFIEDPLRGLRAMQLLARKAKTVDPETMKVIREMSDQFSTIAKERVFEEFSKLLLKADKPSIGLNFLLESNWLRHFPELYQFAFWDGWKEKENAVFKDTAPEFMTSGCPQNPEWHPEGDVWIHNNMVVDAAAKVRHMVEEDLQLTFMFGALLHDLGKVVTTLLPQCTAHAHDCKGKELTETFMARITTEKKLTKQVIALVVNHLQPFMLTSGEAKSSAWKRLHKKVFYRLDILGWLSRSDWAGRPNRNPLVPCENGIEMDHPASALCWKWQRTLGQKPIEPIIMGRDLIAVGIEPGRCMGIILKHTFETQIDNPHLTKSELLEIALYLKNNHVPPPAACVSPEVPSQGNSMNANNLIKTLGK